MKRKRDEMFKEEKREEVKNERRERGEVFEFLNDLHLYTFPTEW